MKVLIYVNKQKEGAEIRADKLRSMLDKIKIEYRNVSDYDFDGSFSADALFVFGGDGTILRLVRFASDNSLPIIGINAGKLGFLSEFEADDMQDAVDSFASGKLKTDERTMLSVEFKGKDYIALNDAVIQRLYSEDSQGGLITNVKVQIDGNIVDKIRGDGVIVSTPTGSTAYSLSAGGSILAPDINAFSITPINAHSLHNKPVIYSADSECELELNSGNKAGVFIDGKFIGSMILDDKIKIRKSTCKTVFLRRENSNFYDRLLLKLNSPRG